MKKKIVAMMLVGVMVVMNNAVAFGVTTPETVSGDNTDFSNNTSKKNVMVKNTNSKTVYSIEIKWGDMNFSADPGDWDPSSHKYGWDGVTVGGDSMTWNPEIDSGADQSNKIVVTNHSNTAVSAAFAFNNTTQADGTTINGSDVGTTFNGSFNPEGNMSLATGEGRIPTSADSNSKTLFLTSGRPDKKLTSYTAIGHVTVTIS